MPMPAEPIPGQITAACQAVRPAAPDDAVAGVQPLIVATPASTEEASALLRAADGLGLAVVPRGAGTRLHWGNPPERCDLVIETTSLDQVIEHAAGDLVATVQAGLRLDRLAEVLESAGQRLALDPPALSLPAHGRPAAGRPASTRGTVGGVLATGAAGPLRLRYGTGRDLLLGITVVRADGAVAKSGGKVVKNVAGYDLGKLFAGSGGTLGLITQATFRLHPLPARTAYVTATCAAAVDACRVIGAVMRSPASPVAAEINWPSANQQVQVTVALEGDPAGVAERSAELAGLLGREGVASVADEPPPWWGAGPAAQPDGTVLQIAFWPAELGVVLAGIRAAATAAGLDLGVGGSAATGVLCASAPAGADPGAVAEFVTSLRIALGKSGRAPAQPGDEHGGRAPARPGDGQGGRAPAPPADGQPARASVVVLHAPPEVGKLVDLFGPVPSLALMRAVKNQFDPARTMAPGRFAGGI
jgi:glycolate oxidase FAD binding subunit